MNSLIFKNALNWIKQLRSIGTRFAPPSTRATWFACPWRLDIGPSRSLRRRPSQSGHESRRSSCAAKSMGLYSPVTRHFSFFSSFFFFFFTFFSRRGAALTRVRFFNLRSRFVFSANQRVYAFSSSSLHST
jgi:hypothetical protein